MEAVWFHYVLLCAICENLRRKVFKNPGRNSGRVDSLQQMCCNSLVFGAARDVPVFSAPATIASDIDAQRQYFAMCEKAEENESTRPELRPGFLNTLRRRFSQMAHRST
ncbi:hypothetical protein BaRGS_00001371 [Batillaria attramentaria]|uniref:Uncharacterized protein n=1 Tax=Batillaria attramentaria TaxID=370345 RepID=A0ABD0M7W7_9CAEN